MLKRKNGIDLPKVCVRALILPLIAGMAVSFTSCKSIVKTLSETVSEINSTTSDSRTDAPQNENDNSIFAETSLPPSFSEDTAEAADAAETAVTEDSGGAETVVLQTGEAQPVSGIRPEFKETMDSYEKFYKEYVDFLKKYESSDNALSMLTEYLDYLSEFAEMGEKLDALDTSDMSEEETAYYLEVMARITKLLGEL